MTDRDRASKITTCAAFGCCEPRANDTFEFCDRHARELRLFNLWLHDAMPIGHGRETPRVKGDDPRSSFSVTRSHWAHQVRTT